MEGSLSFLIFYMLMILSFFEKPILDVLGMDLDVI